jgi:hypothetical protein
LLAANRFGRLGVDDAATLKDLLEQLDCGQTTTDTGQLLADLTGYDLAERERLACQFHVPEMVDNSKDGSKKGSNYFDPSGKTAFFAVGEVASPVEYELLKTAEAALRQQSQGYTPDEMRTFMETQLRKLTEA